MLPSQGRAWRFKSARGYHYINNNMSEENIIFEKYITEIAFTTEHEPIQEFFIAFWMVEDYEGTIDFMHLSSIEEAADFISIGQTDKLDEITKRLLRGNLSIFYAIDKQEDNKDITILLVGSNIEHISESSRMLNILYRSSTKNFFNILKTSGFNIR